MKFRSTRGDEGVDLATALARGIAPDGGLYIPEDVATLEIDSFADCSDLVSVAKIYLQAFFEGDKLADSLDEICNETFSFPIPLLNISASGTSALSILELFHGPTAAFKDVGAGFLAASLSRLADAEASSSQAKPLLILVATSGDTGGAVAAAFHQRAGFEVAVLYPKGRVSARQEHQLTCWGGNVTAFCVDGSFDDCQRLVKSAFADAALNKRYRLSSANSINIGRLLPQSVYYAYAAIEHYRQHRTKLNLVIPTGNLGNGLAAILARARGIPIGDIVLATNANTTIPDFLGSGVYEGRDSVATLASAMDVGNPSNMERLRHLFGESDALNELICAVSCDDARIVDVVKQVYAEHGMAICPHTACAFAAYQDLTERQRARAWAVVATAHPAKFNDIVEPAIQTEVEIPEALAELLDRPSRFVTINPELGAFSISLDETRR